ncbi:DUF3857 domain-containing protein [Parerythrobacter aestuarii]|uniref:DUF3857 domain-containing protein n=1 Tax=Parerythrobacter aestuarii TaxID=3020909 RepID=UPI0024DEDB8F|nr:DUF3857 domain-containing protein [Parerythrobacter aestuarii]
MNRYFCFAAPIIVPTVLLAQPVQAGEEVLYEPAPEWVEIAALPEMPADAEFPVVLADKQARLEDGRVWRYQDAVLSLSTPQMLTQFGTLSANWLPDKGDLIVHRLELVRDGGTIDLIADGAKFEVIRRERRLERRMVDGQLTATINLPGARVGDIVRLAYSVTLSDQALGDKMQFTERLLAGDLPVGKAAVSISWPEDEDIVWATQGELPTPEPVLEDGYYKLTIDLPLAEQKDKPSDAPARFRLPPLVQATNLDGYADLSRVMAPYYATTGTIDPEGEIAAQVARIMAEHDTPLARAAAATKLVQDEISYLLNGLDGGNYLPQSPAETWEQRYGDCKAKTLLLLAMLHEMGIEADPVLVKSSGGDTVSVLLPLAGNFDHVIVRAQIDGETYWLDGTSAGTRLENIADVPRFYFALPIGEKGAELIDMAERPKALPDQLVSLKVDQSAGLFLPGLFDVTIETRGAAASQWELVLKANEKMRQQSLDAAVAGALGEANVIEADVTYDKELSVATVTAKGVIWSGWDRKRGYSESTVPAQVLSSLSVSADRARAEWKELPLAVYGPSYSRSETTILLPHDGDGISMRGEDSIDQVAAGARVESVATLDGDVLRLEQSYRTVEREIPADRIRAEKIAAARLTRNLPRLRANTDARERWQYFGKDRKLLEPIEQSLDRVIDRSIELDEGIAAAYALRGAFRRSVYDYAGAVADYTRANDEEASSVYLEERAANNYLLGRLEAALDDYRQVEELTGNGDTLYMQMEILAYLGRHDEAIAVAEEYEAFAEEANAAETLSYALSYAGKRDEGSALLEETILLEPDETWLLNTACWQAAIFDDVDDGVLDICTDAVESSGSPASSLDSRALAYYRVGELDKALADVDAALALSPAMAGSRYLRGLIRLAMGDAKGKEDVDAGLAMRPVSETEYKLWNLLPPS